MQGMKILILNGPNLNLQGRRDVAVYGTETFEHYVGCLRAAYPGVAIDYAQSNIEGELIDAIQRAEGVYDGIVFNAGGYTHTSVSLRDAVSAVPIPVVEVHISSLLAPVAVGSVMGFGLLSYELGLLALLRRADEAAGIRASDLQ